jgi:hypothetical protein
MERPVVAVLPAGQPAAELGTGEVEVEVIDCAPPTQLGVVELSSEPDPQAAIPLASVLVLVDRALAPAAAAGLARAAAAGVTIVDPATAPIGLADAAPRILIALDAAETPTGATPRTRIGVVATSGAEARTADVLWKTTMDAPTFWAELDAELASLAAHREPGT